MPWLLKGLLLALKTRWGRRVLVVGGMGAIELVRSDRARAAYARARDLATDQHPRRAARAMVKRLGATIKR